MANVSTQEVINQLYAGVNITAPPAHAHLLPSWVRPEAPEDFPNIVAIRTLVTDRATGVKSLAWFIDFLNTETCSFASEESDDGDVGVQWPWVEGFEPGACDWDAIGIPHLC